MALRCHVDQIVEKGLPIVFLHDGKDIDERHAVLLTDLGHLRLWLENVCPLLGEQFLSELWPKRHHQDLHLTTDAFHQCFDRGKLFFKKAPGFVLPGEREAGILISGVLLVLDAPLQR